MSAHSRWSERVNQETRIEGPHGWIQWKGTNVCMDVQCSCGHRSHFDGEFFYHWQCSACGKRFIVGPYVRMVEATPEEAAEAGIEWQQDEPGTRRID